ncbi:MAG: glycoside hydrolase family 30 protein, partial [Cyclobacteriaceae bacterium]
WIDWNMVLDRQGGPNWFKNWCVAPVIVDPEADEVYFTPLYYTMSHFSKYIRPGAQRIGFELSDDKLQVTAAQNKDGSIVLVVFNEENETRTVRINLQGKTKDISINGQAIQTVTVQP